MTTKEIQQRNEKAEQLRVMQTDSGQFYVESGEGKILYRVIIEDGETSCTCGDFAKNSKKGEPFNCKHILAVTNAIPRQEIEGAVFLERFKPQLDERFIMQIEGKDFVKYAGLLDLGHQKGLEKIEVSLTQIPNKENDNTAICSARVESKTGEVFTDIGDANPNNCTSRVVKHLIRMASTRSIARALRTFTNIGMTCLEELSDISDAMEGENGNGRAPTKNATRPKAVQNRREKPEEKPAEKPVIPKEEPAKTSAPEQKPAEKPPQEKSQPAKPASNGKASSGNGSSDAPKMSEAQKRAIYNLSRRRGISVEELEKTAVETFGSAIESLSSKDASSFIRNLQQAA